MVTSIILKWITFGPTRSLLTSRRSNRSTLSRDRILHEIPCALHTTPVQQSSRIKCRESSNTLTSSPALLSPQWTIITASSCCGVLMEGWRGLTSQGKAKYSKAAPRTLDWAKGFSLQQDNGWSSQGHSQVCSKETESFLPPERDVKMSDGSWNVLEGIKKCEKWKGLKTFWRLF